MIEFQDVDKSFGDLQVLHAVSFRVRRGEVLGLVGPSGSGKTTVLRLIAGVIEPDRGRVLRSSDRIGYVFQEPRLLPWRSALDNIALVLRAAGLDRRHAQQQAQVWMERLGLAGFERYYPSELSGGMTQRVAIGRAFAVQPDIVLMDEPFSGLDYSLKDRLLARLKTLIDEEGTTVVYVTHDLPEALRMCGRILELERGDGVREYGRVGKRAW